MKYDLHPRNRANKYVVHGLSDIENGLRIVYNARFFV
jgi:hypothetical protein